MGATATVDNGGLIGGGMTTVTTASDKGVSGGHSQGATVALAG